MFVKIIEQVNRLKSFHKFGLSVAIGILFSFVIPVWSLKGLARLILGWDVFCVCLLTLFWITFYTTPPKGIRKEARLMDSRNIMVFFVVLIVAALSFLSVILLFINHSKPVHQFRLIVIVACLFLSWMVLHTIFAIRYAHLYYSDHRTKKNTFAGGLEFPDEKEPDFVDFAYFSFTLGMTFQVSDVEISGRKIRRIALWHGLLSFGFNATIVAMTVNIIAGLS